MKLAVRGTDVGPRMTLAQDEATPPEILYFLASDPDAGVRFCVAANRSTPPKADLLLARDSAETIRGELAVKTAQRFADAIDQSTEASRATLSRVLERLGGDEQPEIRALVSRELARATDAPVSVVRALALDRKSVVAMPVLQFSPLLSDADLIEVLEARPRSGPIVAIARRQHLVEAVSHAVAQTRDIDAMSALIGNPTASVSSDTLDLIAREAQRMAALHEPLIQRIELVRETGTRLAGFVSQPLVDMISLRFPDKPPVPPKTEVLVGDLAETARQRAPATPDKAPKPVGELPETELRPNVAREVDVAPAMLRARELFSLKRLDEGAIASALDSRDRPFVVAALALKSGLRLPTVERMIASRNPRIILALSWRCGLGARVAAKIQLIVARIPPGDVIGPREDDGSYRLPVPLLQRELAAFAV